MGKESPIENIWWKSQRVKCLSHKDWQRPKCQNQSWKAQSVGEEKEERLQNREKQKP